MSVHAALVGLAVTFGSVLAATTLGLVLVHLVEYAVQGLRHPSHAPGPTGADPTP